MRAGVRGGGRLRDLRRHERPGFRAAGRAHAAAGGGKEVCAFVKVDIRDWEQQKAMFETAVSMSNLELIQPCSVKHSIN